MSSLPKVELKPVLPPPRVPAVNPATRDLNYSSPSAIARFNAAEDGCPAKWWLRYVQGEKEPTTAKQELGTALHAQLEHYLGTGEDVLGKIARPGKSVLPAPGQDLLLEWGLNHQPKKVEDEFMFDPRESRVVLSCVPIVGYIDVLNPRGEYVNGDGVLTKDAPGTVEVVDHKTTSNILKWSKKGETLISTTQMALYGLFVQKVFPRASNVRLSHIYYSTETPYWAKKETMFAPLAIITKRAQEVAAILEQMRRVAKIEKLEDVPKHLPSCPTFGGCKFRHLCHKNNPMQKVKLMSLVSRLRSQVGSNGVVATPAAVVAQPSALTPEPVAASNLMPACNAQPGTTYLMGDGRVLTHVGVSQGKFLFIDLAGGPQVLLTSTEKVSPAPVAAAPAHEWGN